MICKKTNSAGDRALITGTNDRWIRKFWRRQAGDQAEETSRYAKTNIRLKVQDRAHGWSSQTILLEDPDKPRIPNRVAIDVLAVGNTDKLIVSSEL